MWGMKTPTDMSRVEWAAFVASPWVVYVMLALSMIVELRHFALRSNSARLGAYKIALISNAFAPIAWTLGYSGKHLDAFLQNALHAYALIGGMLFSLVSCAIVSFLCFRKDRSSGVTRRMLPAGFATLGAIENWLVALVILTSI
jgi:hypothetical protein